MPATGNQNSAAPVQTVNVSQLASLYLKAINAPDTTGNHQAMMAWLSLESGRVGDGSQTRVVGNNPLNIEGVGDCGSRVYLARRFAVYCSLQSGADHTASLLENNPQYGYTKIVNAFRSDAGPEAIITAIGKSSWAGGNYGSEIMARYDFLFNNNLKLTAAEMSKDTSGLTGSGSSAPTIPADNQTIINAINAAAKPGTGQTWNDLVAALPNEDIQSNVLSVFDQVIGPQYTKPVTQADVDAVDKWFATNPLGKPLGSNPLGLPTNIGGPSFNISTGQFSFPNAQTDFIKIGIAILAIVLIIMGLKRVIDSVGKPATEASPA